MIYDIIIIGGGISGLNSALKLSKNNKILLIDDRKYWGGRIHTKQQPHYEEGAARFNDKHILLNNLINKYNLTKEKIMMRHDYLDIHNMEIIKDVDKRLDEYFIGLIQKSKKWSSDSLKRTTLYEFMNRCNSIEYSNEIVNKFGYYSEIMEMNAYDALNTFKNDFVNVQYYYLSDGLSMLCNKIKNEVENNGGICKNNTTVKNIKKNKMNIFEIETNNTNYYCNQIIFAIKGYQLRKFKLLQPIHRYIQSVYNAELLRIYAKYPIRKNGVWFSNIKRLTTNSFLRQIIPIDYSTGLIMISYTDGRDIQIYKDKYGKLLSETIILNIIHKELNKLFNNVPKPIYFKTHYWKVGAHHWKPGYDSDIITKIMLNPLNNIYICGEAFSTKQAWMEGALETSEKVIKLLSE